MKTYIVCAMPGSGKTWTVNNIQNTKLRKLKIINMDDIYFFDMFYKPEYHEEIIKKFGKKIVNYSLQECMNPNFAKDYSSKIKELYDSNEYNFILTGIHWDVRLELYKMNLPYFVVMPDYNDEDSYINRLSKDRSEGMLNYMHYTWTSMETLYVFEIDRFIKLGSKSYLIDALDQIYCDDRYIRIY